MGYDLLRSRRRTYSVEVHPNGDIIVRVPLRATRSGINEFLTSRTGWIRQRLLASAVARSVVPPITEPRQFHHRGRAVQWFAASGLSQPLLRLGEQEGALHIPERRAADEESGWRFVRAWQRRAAEHLFRAMIHEHLPMMGVHGLRYRDVKLRRMRRRWGSCTSGGLVTLNETLIRTPDPCIRTVVVHELVHLLHLHHGPAFHAHMAQLLPEYRTYDELLDRWSAILLEDRPKTHNGADGSVERGMLMLGQ